MKDDELIIHIKEDKAVKLEIVEKGTVRTKNISPQALFEAIKGSIKEDAVSTGILPSNIIALKIGQNARYAVVEYPYETADITYIKTEYKDFPLPRLLFVFTIENSGRISQVNLGIPAPGKLTPETQMFFYPFSNVRGFHMCTGANTLPYINDLQLLKNMPDYILSLPDNDDYFDANHNQKKMSRRDLMEHLVDKNRQYYYDSVLIPMPGTTLKNFL